MNSKELIYRLIYQALLDIREASYEGKGSHGIFKLADLFHNIPLKLAKITNDNEAYDDLVADLRDKARLKGYDSWLENCIRQFTEGEGDTTMPPLEDF